jgi:hypothetical protein
MRRMPLRLLPSRKRRVRKGSLQRQPLRPPAASQRLLILQDPPQRLNQTRRLLRRRSVASPRRRVRPNLRRKDEPPKKPQHPNRLQRLRPSMSLKSLRNILPKSRRALRPNRSKRPRRRSSIRRFPIPRFGGSLQPSPRLRNPLPSSSPREVKNVRPKNRMSAQRGVRPKKANPLQRHKNLEAAFSYTRYSTLAQEQGDSECRQIESARR